MNEEFAGFKIIRDPYCPPDTMYLINDEYVLMFKPTPKLTRWQRFLLWFKRRFSR